MIPPLSIEVYPPNTLEGLIARKWVHMICECEDHTINTEPIQEVIQKTRDVMRAAGWPPMSTVGQPGGRMGPPTCGTKTVTMGQTCMSPTRAAG